MTKVMDCKAEAETFEAVPGSVSLDYMIKVMDC